MKKLIRSLLIVLTVVWLPLVGHAQTEFVQSVASTIDIPVGVPATVALSTAGTVTNFTFYLTKASATSSTAVTTFSPTASGGSNDMVVRGRIFNLELTAANLDTIGNTTLCWKYSDTTYVEDCRFFQVKAAAAYDLVVSVGPTSLDSIWEYPTTSIVETDGIGYQLKTNADFPSSDIESRLPAALTVGGKMVASMDEILAVAQSATDLKDFADAGYDPATNKVQGLVLADSLTAVATGGITAASIAADAIGASEIATDAITATELADNTITAAKIATDAIGAAEIAADAIGAAEIATDAITATEIAADAIGASEIATSAIGALEIATDAITAAEIAADSIGATEIAADAITAAKIAANAITTSELADGTITAAKIATDAITTTQLADGTITAAKIATDAITATKIAADSITSAELATTAVTEIQTGLLTVPRATAYSTWTVTFFNALGAGQTGLAAGQISCNVFLDGGAANAVDDTSETELDATNAPGTYVFDLTATEMTGNNGVVVCITNTVPSLIARAYFQTQH